MAELLHDGAPHPFVMRLRELHALAGSPALSELCRLSRSNKACMELRKSTVSDVLTGKRKRVPKWTFVHSFVTTCATAAGQGGLDVGGMGDIQAWYACWRAAHDAAALTPVPALSGATALAVAPPAAVLAPPPQPPAVLAPPSQPVPGHLPRPVAELAPVVGAEPAPVVGADPAAPASGVLPWRPRRPVPGDPAEPPVLRGVPDEGAEEPAEPVSEKERELLRIYGRTGLRLLRESDPADGRDCMRLAVVTLLRNHPDVARDWLRRAGDAGRHEATELFNHPRPEERAAGHAYLHGIGYQEAEPPRLSYAMFFFLLAASRGHAGAAFRLAKAHRANREDWTAEKWLRRAAEGGDPLAASVLDGARTAVGGTDPALLADLLDRMPVPEAPPA
ncbi:hypothetical protein [Nonomuraea roseoviolacea]|uniref:Sel1 repeat family protein n=1 Tax=Nonomuraea roseoviolacea subsp. carminata TaxID=160689 RepID=A0ABT1K1G7_9ACTN|nr:hypothetical protein [Nonomuraea roseoviolacea]MCP2347840.1 hypothetical protein [Nonomuraea roseoviolacea subsp. carminata]